MHVHAAHDVALPQHLHLLHQLVLSPVALCSPCREGCVPQSSLGRVARLRLQPAPRHCGRTDAISAARLLALPHLGRESSAIALRSTVST